MEICKFQQIKELQQQISYIKRSHKREIENANKKLSSKDDEFSYLRNHNKILLIEMKKLRKEKKSEQETLKKLISKESLINKETM